MARKLSILFHDGESANYRLSEKDSLPNVSVDITRKLPNGGWLTFAAHDGGVVAFHLATVKLFHVQDVSAA